MRELAEDLSPVSSSLRVREYPTFDVKATMKNYAPQRGFLLLATGAVSDSDSLLFSSLSIISLQVGGQVCKALEICHHCPYLLLCVMTGVCVDQAKLVRCV